MLPNTLPNSAHLNVVCPLLPNSCQHDRCRAQQIVLYYILIIDAARMHASNMRTAKPSQQDKPAHVHTLQAG